MSITLPIPRDKAGNPLIRYRLVTGKHWTSKLIKLRTNCQLSHGEVEDGEGWFTSSYENDHGVKRRSPEYYGKISEYIRFGIPVTEKQALDFYTFIANQIGKPYDWSAIEYLALGVAASILPVRNWRNTDSWYCFELVAGGLEAANVISMPQLSPLRAVTGETLIAIGAALATEQEVGN